MCASAAGSSATEAAPPATLQPPGRLPRLDLSEWDYQPSAWWDSASGVGGPADRCRGPCVGICACPPCTPRRLGLLTTLFRMLDWRGRGLLDSQDMRLLAELMGFDSRASSKQWEAEFASLCDYLCCAPQEGLSFALFLQLVNDTSPRGCYCTSQELQSLIERFSFRL